MTERVSYVPKGQPNVAPYLVVNDVVSLIDFLKKVFGAQEQRRTRRPDGSIMHAEVRLGDSIVMMGEAGDGDPFPGMIHVYVEDADAVYRRALEAGAATLREPRDELHGDRMAGVQDPFGNQWWMSTHFEDVTDEEHERRAQANMQGPQT